MTVSSASLFARGGGAFLAAVVPSLAAAHASEQALVLLLPTHHYVIGGAATVLATIVLIAFAPKTFVDRLFAPIPFRSPNNSAWIATATSLLSFVILLFILCVGLLGPRDPLANLLPLTIWTGWWITCFALCGIFGNLWRHFNPWTGLYGIVGHTTDKPIATLPDSWGAAPAIAIFLVFAAFYVADPAPSDPARLAVIVGVYWCLTFVAMIVFGGAQWLARGETFSVVFDLIARNAPFGNGPRAALGFPGWATLITNRMPVSLGITVVLILAFGSFDGLKETFWWLSVFNVNPLEFPGRTDVIGSSLIGLMIFSGGLVTVFWCVVWLCGRVAALGPDPKSRISSATLFCAFAPTLLPITLGYHISHFLTAFLIDGQHLIAAMGDPFGQGSNLLGLADRRVTTGFLNTPASVQVIWLTQVGIVVTGHIISVLASHCVALKYFGTSRRGAVSQSPLSLFMVLYTLFGLWLLAAPRIG